MNTSKKQPSGVTNLGYVHVRPADLLCGQVAVAAYEKMLTAECDTVGTVDAIRSQPEYEQMTDYERERALKILNLIIWRKEADQKAAAIKARKACK